MLGLAEVVAEHVPMLHLTRHNTVVNGYRTSGHDSKLSVDENWVFTMSLSRNAPGKLFIGRGNSRDDWETTSWIDLADPAMMARLIELLHDLRDNIL